MSKCEENLILGVDGGGTNTIAWIAEIENSGAVQVIGRGRGGSSNIHGVGTETALQNLDEAIQDAFQSANTPPAMVAAASFAMAGSDRETERMEIQNWALRRLISKTISVSNDALPVIYAANHLGVGIGLIAGTGSFCLGRREDGQTCRCGGWGSLFGDEGSGYSIAVSALRAASRDEDQRGPATILRQSLLEKIGMDSLNQAVSYLYSPSTTRAEIASLADLVFNAADGGDSIAMEILSSAAASLAELVVTIGNRQFYDHSTWCVAMGGGLLVNREEFIDQVTKQIETTSNRTINRVIVNDPVTGVLNMAHELYLNSSGVT